MAFYAALVLLFLFAFVHSQRAPGQLELELGRAVRRLTVVRGSREVRGLGRPIAIVVALCWLTIFGAALRRGRVALVLAAGALFTAVLNDRLLQQLATRPGVRTPDGLISPDYFPSGHVTAVACTAAATVVLLLLAGVPRRVLLAAISLATALTVAIAWASVFVTAHYVYDVVGAFMVAIIGMSVTAIVATHLLDQSASSNATIDLNSPTESTDTPPEPPLGRTADALAAANAVAATTAPRHRRADQRPSPLPNTARRRA